MSWLSIVLRALHIGAGVFWAGSMMFNAKFLMPSLADAGPAAGPVMQALLKRGMATALPATAIITIVSGAWLMWRDAAGSGGAFMGSPTGITLSIGAVGAVLAFLIGMTVVRPNMMKAATATDPAHAQQFRAKAAVGNRISSAGIGISVLCMAIARYVG